MDGGARASVVTFHHDAALVAGERATLGEATAHHVRVRRLTPGADVQLTDGAGILAAGRLAHVGRASIEVEVTATRAVAPPPPLALFIPVADRDRMLWLAEKATELQVTVWQPVRFARSRSVASRGEGESFAKKVRARMIGALEQSAGAWLPAMRDEIDPGEIVEHLDDAAAFLLDVEGTSLAHATLSGPLALVVGPEGGLTPEERGRLVDGGLRLASLASITLRFETAAIVAAGIVRAQQR